MESRTSIVAVAGGTGFVGGAIARELAGYIWAIGQVLPPPVAKA